MKIAVIAANGRSGQVFVESALDAGHEIFAGVRSNNPFPKNKKLHVVRCDATKQSDIEKLVKDADSVVSLIGHVKGSKADVQTMAIDNTINAMKKVGISRLVSLTGTGVRVKGDKIPFYDHLLTIGIKIIDPDRVRDGVKAADLMRSSGLDWTLLRVLKLQDLPTSSFKLTLHGPTKLYVSRKDVAAAILDILGNDGFKKSSPIMSKKDNVY